MLIYTLWLLLGGVVVLASLVALSGSHARSARAELTALKVRAAAESAAHAVIFGLIQQRSVPPGAPEERQVTIDGVAVRTRLVSSDGLLDFNAASEADLVVALVAFGFDDATRRAVAIKAGRPYTVLSELATAAGIGVEGLSCLARFGTLSSGLSRPIAALAPPMLAPILAADPNPARGIAAATSTGRGGSAHSIHVVAGTAQQARAELAATAATTGRVERPVLISEWVWFDSGAVGPAPCGRP